MNLSTADIERLLDWGRHVFIQTEVDWSLADDELLDRLYQYQRALSTN